MDAGDTSFMEFDSGNTGSLRSTVVSLADVPSLDLLSCYDQVSGPQSPQDPDDAFLEELQPTEPGEAHAKNSLVTRTLGHVKPLNGIQAPPLGSNGGVGIEVSTPVVNGEAPKSLSPPLSQDAEGAPKAGQLCTSAVSLPAATWAEGNSQILVGQGGSSLEKGPNVCDAGGKSHRVMSTNGNGTALLSGAFFPGHGAVPLSEEEDGGEGSGDAELKGSGEDSGDGDEEGEERDPLSQPPEWDQMALAAADENHSEKFVWALEGFFRERGDELVVPKFYGTPVDVMKLFKIVQEYGGYGVCVQQKLWKKVGSNFRPPESCTTVSTQFRKSYEQALLAFERHLTAVKQGERHGITRADFGSKSSSAHLGNGSKITGNSQIDLSANGSAPSQRQPTARLAAKRAAKEAAAAAAGQSQSSRALAGSPTGFGANKAMRSGSLAAAYAATGGCVGAGGNGHGAGEDGQEGYRSGGHQMGWGHAESETRVQRDSGAMLPSMQDGETLPKQHRVVDGVNYDGEDKVAYEGSMTGIRKRRKKKTILPGGPGQAGMVALHGYENGGSASHDEDDNSEGENGMAEGEVPAKRQRTEGKDTRPRTKRKPQEVYGEDPDEYMDPLFRKLVLDAHAGKMLKGTVTDEGPPCRWVQVNVRRVENCFEIFALVPGLLRRELVVTCEQSGRLVIIGSPGRESPWGVIPFRKVVHLPERINTSETSADMTLHGQLYVKAPALLDG